MHTTQQKKETNMEQKKEQRKFEFTLYLNENIIVQRYFNIIGFNKRAINSINFKEAVDENMELIKGVLKRKAVDFLNENSRNFYEIHNFEQNESNDKMKITVKHDGDVIAYREWDATIYPVKVRYTVDVRQHIYELITKIQKCLCTPNKYLETEYMGYDLQVEVQ
jgi:hypothetical protein